MPGVVDVLAVVGDAATDTAASLALGDCLAKLVNEQRRRSNGLETTARHELGVQLRHIDASRQHANGQGLKSVTTVRACQP